MANANEVARDEIMERAVKQGPTSQKAALNKQPHAPVAAPDEAIQPTQGTPSAVKKY